MGLFAKENKEEIFWKWFEKNEMKIFQFENDQETILDSISEHLNLYHESLVFEISQETNGKREIIISADGIEELFPSVESLVKETPSLNRWSVIAFRPRMENYSDFGLTYSGKEFDPKKLWIYYRVENGFFDLIIYFPDYIEDQRDTYVNAAYVLLDMALGEYDVVKSIRYIDFQKSPVNPKENGLQPFSELRSVFDKYKNSKD